MAKASHSFTSTSHVTVITPLTLSPAHRAWQPTEHSLDIEAALYKS